MFRSHLLKGKVAPRVLSTRSRENLFHKHLKFARSSEKVDPCVLEVVHLREKVVSHVFKIRLL